MPSRLIQIRLYATPLRMPGIHIPTLYRRRALVAKGGRLRIRWGRALPLARRSARLPACDVSPKSADLVHVVYVVWRFRVLLFYVQIEVAAEGGGCEGLVAVWTFLVFGGRGFACG